ncbi:MAG TPA: hypothetical protein VN577_08985 [Terriglobales bacterium]|nr:hypothetical protein [Terriglobales bacterium]
MSTPRVQLIAKLSPQDHQRIKERAETESRSIGETIALILKENELLKVLQEREA